MEVDAFDDVDVDSSKGDVGCAISTEAKTVETREAHGPQGTLRFAMYMDEESFRAYNTGYVPWLDGDWNCDGIDNALFEHGIIPMALGSAGEKFALMKFARAHRAGHVAGAPRYLLKGSLPASAALGHMLAQPPEILLLHDRPEPTVGFTRTLKPSNYPDMTFDDLIDFDNVSVRKQLLESGLEALLSK